MRRTSIKITDHISSIEFTNKFLLRDYNRSLFLLRIYLEPTNVPTCFDTCYRYL